MTASRNTTCAPARALHDISAICTKIALHTRACVVALPLLLLGCDPNTQTIARSGADTWRVVCHPHAVAKISMTDPHSVRVSCVNMSEVRR